jgi:hypothetical protein
VQSITQVKLSCGYQFLDQAQAAARGQDVDAARAILGELGVGGAVLKKLASHGGGLTESKVKDILYKYKLDSTQATTRPLLALQPLLHRLVEPSREEQVGGL